LIEKQLVFFFEFSYNNANLRVTCNPSQQQYNYSAVTNTSQQLSIFLHVENFLKDKLEISI